MYAFTSIVPARPEEVWEEDDFSDSSVSWSGNEPNDTGCLETPNVKMTLADYKHLA